MQRGSQYDKNDAPSRPQLFNTIANTSKTKQKQKTKKIILYQNFMN